MNGWLINHAQLAKWLECELMKIPAFVKNEVNVDILATLDRDELESFFSYDAACGIYIGSGEYTASGLEEVAVALVIGVRNLSDKTAALGTGNEDGAWQLLQAAKTALAASKTVGTNISDLRPQKWQNLLVRSDIALIGLDVKITLYTPEFRRCECTLNGYNPALGY